MLATPVPETPIDEDGHPFGRKQDVGLAALRDTLYGAVDTKPKTPPVEQTP
jgi:hypothetical protein